MIFEIRGVRKATGERVVAKVEASSREHAVERLARRGITPIALSEHKRAQGGPGRLVPDSQVISRVPASPSDGIEQSESPVTQCNGDQSNTGQPIRRRRGLLAAGAVAIAGLTVVILVVANGSRPHSTSEAATNHAAANQALPIVSDSTPSPAPVPTLPANVIRLEGGKLTPAPGYTWATAKAGDFSVRWKPGLRHSSYANITSAQKEGYWVADPGYSFTAKDSLRVQWQPGARDSQNPHLEAGPSPGDWHPLPGYAWTHPNDPDSLTVAWKAGVPHPTAAHVVSGTNEGNWRPASGYRWASNRTGDLSVVRAGPTEEQLKSAIPMVVLALLTDELGNRANDGSLGGAFVHDLAKGTRNEAIRKALTDLFPNETPLTISAAANIIILGADGQLTSDNWKSATARDALVARIREEDPFAADAYQVAEFIGNVLDTYEQQRR